MKIILEIIILYLAFWAINFFDLFLTTLFGLVWILLRVTIYQGQRKPCALSVPKGFCILASANLWTIIMNALIALYIILCMFDVQFDHEEYFVELGTSIFIFFIAIGFRILHQQKEENKEISLESAVFSVEANMWLQKLGNQLAVPFYNYYLFYRDWVCEYNECDEK